MRYTTVPVPGDPRMNRARGQNVAILPATLTSVQSKTLSRLQCRLSAICRARRTLKAIDDIYRCEKAT